MDGLRFTEEDLANMDEAESKAMENQSYALAGEQEEEEDLGLDLEPEDKRDLFDSGMYTLRKVSGQTLEKLAAIFNDEIFERLQQKILQCLAGEDWRVR